MTRWWRHAHLHMISYQEHSPFELRLFKTKNYVHPLGAALDMVTWRTEWNSETNRSLLTLELYQEILRIALVNYT